MNKKTYIVKVITNGKTVPDLGLGKGVLLEREVVFTDTGGQGFDSPLFIRAKIENEDALLREVCRVEWKEKDKKEKKHVSKH